MRIWGKIFKDNRMLQDAVYTNDDIDTRTHKVFAGLEYLCYEFNLSIPIWLELNIADFKQFSKCRFTSDNFIEEIDFDYLEFHVIEE